MFIQRSKITLATSFPVFPPTTIKSCRIFHLYRHLAQKFDIEIISLTESNQPHFQGNIAAGLREIRIPKSAQHQAAEVDLTSKLGNSMANITLLKLYSLTPNYLQALKKSAKNADILLLYQPYLFPAVREVSNKPIWYEASGIEAQLAKQFLPENDLGHEFWELIHQTEAQCCQTSKLIIIADEHNKDELNRIYQVDPKQIIHFPNGINSETINYVSYEQRLINKEKLGFKETFLAIFSATGHPHNTDEARLILNIASKLPKIKFLILGNAGITFDPRLTPANVGFIRSLDSKTKSLILGLADVALNPAKAISDTLPTMLEYFCAGIPVISTHLGAKSLAYNNQIDFFVDDIWRFPEMLVMVKKENLERQKNKSQKARKYVEENFEWSKIAEELSQKITIFQSFERSKYKQLTKVS
jgi:glycosyltransferase involved in cell wall biosynthesis